MTFIIVEWLPLVHFKVLNKEEGGMSLEKDTRKGLVKRSNLKEDFSSVFFFLQ
jgi:hypothetical protein